VKLANGNIAGTICTITGKNKKSKVAIDIGLLDQTVF